MSALIWERLDMATGIDGVQHTLPQNMTPWHTEHLKPKEFEKTAEAGRARPPVPQPLLKEYIPSLRMKKAVSEACCVGVFLCPALCPTGQSVHTSDNCILFSSV